MKRIVACIAAACFGLAGGVSMAQDKKAVVKKDEKGSCNSAEACTVTVKVAGCSDKEISATPDILKVKRGYKGDVTWKLDAPAKWEFAKDGIAFKDAKASASQFEKPRPGGRDFRWYDKNEGPGEYRYNINLKSPDGKTCTKDPTIMNDVNP